MRPLARTKWILAALAFSLASAISLSAPVSAQTAFATAEFLDVGQGDATLVRSPEGKVALIDAGPSKVILERLHEREVTKIDLIVLSHHHIDHYGGMDDVIREFRPSALLVTDSSFTSPTYLRLLKLIEDEGIPTIFPNDDGTSRKIELGSLTFTVLPQPPEDHDQENNNSIGLRVQHGDAALILPGDAQDAERRFWKANATELIQGCDVLKLAHHGSRNGTDTAWLDMVGPKVAVAMCGRNNAFGHPHPETIDLLASKSIPLKRTDLDGAVTVRSDGKHWSLVGADNEPGPPVAAPEAPPSEDDEPDSGAKVDLNTASEEELKTLPGVGPALARRIMAARPYGAVDDLKRVRGIGKKRFSRLEPHVTVGRQN